MELAPQLVPSAPPAQGGQPTRVRYGVMALLCGLSFLTYFDRVCIVRAQGEIQRDLRLNDSRMGLVMGAFWLAYGLFEIPGGWLGDRFGARRTLTRIVLAWSLFTALSGAASGFASLLTCRLLFGTGEAGAYPNMARVQGRWFPPRTRARAGGLLWLTARWGGAFSPLIFGAMLRSAGSARFRNFVGPIPVLGAAARVPAWRLGFFAAALFGVARVALFYSWFRDEPAAKAGVNDAELNLIRGGRSEIAPHEGARPAGGAGAWRALFTSPSLWALGALYFFGSFGWSFFVSWMPKFLLNVHHVTYEKSEWMSGLPLFCGGISCLAGGWLSDQFIARTGRRRLGRAIFPVCGCATAAAAMYAVRYAHTPRHATALMCLGAAAYDFGQGANWAAIVEIGGARAGAAAGLINMVGNMGNFLQPVIGAFLFHRLGWGALFLAYAGTYLLAGSMWLFIDPTRTFYDRPGAGGEASRGFEVMTAAPPKPA